MYSKGNVTLYSVECNEASPSLKVEAVFTNILEPYPAEITQQEPQLVRFTDSHYFVSPYKTETQKTTVKLATSTVETYTKLTPHSARGNTITLGPYKEIQPFSVRHLTIQYSL
jgi:oligosaccharyltransferase complex subunit alpha (ribophorin I)